MDETSTIEVQGLPELPTRARNSHKGDFGRVLVVAGSRGMSGAVVLCASAALRGGAGVVKAAVPESIWQLVAAGNPCVITLPQINDGHGRFAVQAIEPILIEMERADVVVCGPGMCQAPGVQSLVSTLVEKCPKPLVVDADGLNVLGSKPVVLKQRTLPTLITPHPGEFSHLLECGTADIQRNRPEYAREFANEFNVVLALKGYQTIVTDGRRWYQNTTGNPGMATAGSGDVLTGLIAALISQQLDAFAAAQLGVYLHGLAGDLAREKVGEVSMIASDILDHLPKAFLHYANANREGPHATHLSTLPKVR